MPMNNSNDNNQRQILNRQVMINLIGDDQAMMRKFEIQFLQQAKVSIAKIAELFKNNELKPIKEEAHFLKTSARAIGAEQTADLLQSLEEAALKEDKTLCKEHIILINRAVKEVYGVITNEK
jgi:HPt (histidine-containing phosphotransfer) domain-containing protein